MEDEPRDLLDAAIIGDLKLVEHFINSGADIHQVDDSAFCDAACHGHAEIVELLLKHGANIRAQSDYAYNNAVFHGHDNVLEVLKKHASDDVKQEWEAAMPSLLSLRAMAKERSRINILNL